VAVGDAVQRGAVNRPDTVTVRCPGKVNLHLEVLGRRPDGYHELRTLFAAVGVWDELRLSVAPAGVLELAVEPAGVVPIGEENLVVRAARVLTEGSGATRGARIHLRKGIPIAGGMGGGSSDAAATLVGLSSLWDLEPDPASVLKLGSGLGADVPFFLIGGAAWGTGIGTELVPLPDLPPWWVVLLPGREAVSTAAVYRALRAGPVDERPQSEVYQWIERGGEVPFHACRNDLETTVSAQWPGVARRLAAIRGTHPFLALLSGSGGTVFGLYRDRTAAERASNALTSHAPVIAPLLTREASRVRPSWEDIRWK
jgi:4-diphosphocytidyl-2-C-methyl-D-erythritol kinase